MMTMNFLNIKEECKKHCKHRSQCKLYSFENEEGDEIVKIKRVNVNARVTS